MDGSVTSEALDQVLSQKWGEHYISLADVTAQPSSTYEAQQAMACLLYTSNGETTVTFKDDQYTVTVPLKFEKAEANFVYVFDSQGTPTSMSVDVQYGMGKTLQRAGLNTLMGIGTCLLYTSWILLKSGLSKN